MMKTTIKQINKEPCICTHCSLPKGLDQTLHVQALLRAWSKEGISGILKDHVRHMKGYKGNSALQQHVQVQVHFTWEWRRKLHYILLEG